MNTCCAREQIQGIGTRQAANFPSRYGSRRREYTSMNACMYIYTSMCAANMEILEAERDREGSS